MNWTSLVLYAHKHFFIGAIFHICIVCCNNLCVNWSSCNCNSTRLEIVGDITRSHNFQKLSRTTQLDNPNRKCIEINRFTVGNMLNSPNFFFSYSMFEILSYEKKMENNDDKFNVLCVWVFYLTNFMEFEKLNFSFRHKWNVWHRQHIHMFFFLFVWHLWTEKLSMLECFRSFKNSTLSIVAFLLSFIDFYALFWHNFKFFSAHSWNILPLTMRSIEKAISSVVYVCMHVWKSIMFNIMKIYNFTSVAASFSFFDCFFLALKKNKNKQTAAKARIFQYGAQKRWRTFVKYVSTS